MRVEALAVVARQGLAVERVLEGRRRHEVGRERLAVEVVLVYFERLDPELVDWFQRYGINNAVGQLLPVRRGRHRCESLRLRVTLLGASERHCGCLCSTRSMR